MEWKIIGGYYLTALGAFLIYFISILIAKKVFDEYGNIYKGWFVVHCLVLLILFLAATIQISTELKREKDKSVSSSDIDKYAPKIEIIADKAFIPQYDNPMQAYDIQLQNRNTNSVPVLNLKAKFEFKNKIEEVADNTFLPVGTTIYKEIYKKNADGTEYHYVDEPADTQFEYFKFAVRRANIEGSLQNLNIAILSSKEWPQGVLFNGKIILDTQKEYETTQIQESKAGTYWLEYSYKVKEEIFTNTISGNIPNIDPFEKVDTVFNVDLNLLAQFSKLSPDRGRITLKIDDKNWLDNNNKYYELIQQMKKENLEFHLIRDKDYVLKAEIQNAQCEKTTLHYSDLDELKSDLKNLSHYITVQWEPKKTQLIIDEKIVDVCPLNSQNYNDWGISLGKHGNIDDAIEKFTEAIKANPKNADAYSNLGYAYFLQKKYEQAIQTYKKALKISKSHLNAKNGLRNSFIEMGLIEARKGNFHKAIRLLKKSIKVDPNHYLAYYNIGIIYQKNGDCKSACVQFARSNELNPEHKKTYLQWGTCLKQLGNLIEAENKYKNAIQIDPQYSYAYNNLAVLHRDQGDNESACENFKKALDFSKDNNISDKIIQNMKEINCEVPPI